MPFFCNPIYRVMCCMTQVFCELNKKLTFRRAWVIFAIHHSPYPFCHCNLSSNILIARQARFVSVNDLLDFKITKRFNFRPDFFVRFPSRGIFFSVIAIFYLILLNNASKKLSNMAYNVSGYTNFDLFLPFYKITFS